MKARLVVFPINGRHWCFSRSMDRSVLEYESAGTTRTLKDLWKNISSSRQRLNQNAELIVDFVAYKMDRAWVGLEKAPEGTFKYKLYRLGLRLLARVKPSEIFLKSISKEVTNIEVTYPTSLNPRLVRRRLRHIAMRGTIIHQRYFYGSVSLLPLTMAFAVLPLPNIPFFWTLFRTYSHWQALKGSERLLQLVSDWSKMQNPPVVNGNKRGTSQVHSEDKIQYLLGPAWVLQPSLELEKLCRMVVRDGLTKCSVSDICKAFDLSMVDVLRYKNVL